MRIPLLRPLTSPSSLWSAACGVKVRYTTPRSDTRASKRSRAEKPFSLSSAETVRQRCSTSVFRLYALRPNSESRPLSSCSRETRSTPSQRSVPAAAAAPPQPSAASTRAPSAWLPSKRPEPVGRSPPPRSNRPTARRPHTPHAPCTAKASTTSSTPQREVASEAEEKTTPDTTPTAAARPRSMEAQPAVMPTSPPRMPFAKARRSKEGGERRRRSPLRPPAAQQRERRRRADAERDAVSRLSAGASSPPTTPAQAEERAVAVAAPAAVATHALRRPASLILSRVHPAWTSLLLATSEALEVRELRRSAAAATACGAPPLFGLKWRRDTLQVTAAAFLAQGNMLCVSDRGDRLLLLSYHGLTPAKAVALPWHSCRRPLSSSFSDSALSDSPIPTEDGSPRGGATGGGATAPHCLNEPGVADGREAARRRAVCTVTAITECPGVRPRAADPGATLHPEPGCTHLAVASSHGEVTLVEFF
mmetsp:Transcript_5408/g.16070  ORF Transcript_5408/g.16070 Transcript_5408/m.16070 type:complete len:478 (-) Transcript_5408:107-1540(-)